MGTLVIGLALALSSGAAAADKQTAAAKALGARGAQEYAAGQYEEAAHDLDAAYRLFPAPILLFNLGQCERARGHLVEAIDYYQRYLEAAPNAANASAARKKLQEAQEAKARPLPWQRSKAPALAPAEPVFLPVPTYRDPLPPVASVAGEAPPPVARSHWLGASLVTAAAVCAAFAVVGVVRVAQYDQIQAAKSWSQYGQALEQQENAQNWEYAAIALGSVAVGAGAGAIFTW